MGKSLVSCFFLRHSVYLVQLQVTTTVTTSECNVLTVLAIVCEISQVSMKLEHWGPIFKTSQEDLRKHTHTRLTAFFPDYPVKPVLERQNQSGF